MIGNLSFRNVSATLRSADNTTLFLQSANIDIPKGRYALVCKHANEQLALVDLLCGKRQPSSGNILFNGERSFPIGRVGPFSVPVAGVSMIRHLSVAYDVDYQEARQLFDYLLLDDRKLINQRMSTWPGTARVRFSLIAGLLRPFSIYIFDGALQQANARSFMQLWVPLFAARCRDATLLISSRQIHILKEIADNVLFGQRSDHH
jgi:capsular polysaccharide transport system ATP-binding protein